MSQEEVRSLYSEFKGYLSQLPLPKDSNENMWSEDSWDQYNGAINELNRVTGKNYDRFLIRPPRNEEYVNLATFRQRLHGLISRLHTEYFSKEPEPFSGGPGIVISQNQQQTQLIRIGQGGMARSRKAQMFQLPLAASKTSRNFTERIGVAQLAEEHGDKLTPATKSFGMTFGLGFFHHVLELDVRKEL